MLLIRRYNYIGRLKALLVVFNLFFLPVFNGQCLAASGNLKLSVLLDKTEYKTEEPINISFKLDNQGQTPVYVNKRFYLNSEALPKKDKEVYLIVTASSGKKLSCKFSYTTGLPKTDYFELLGPGKEISSEYKRDLRGYFDLNQPGVYQVIAVYENVYGQEIGLDVFKDKLTSLPVSFKIINSDSNNAKTDKN